MILHINDEDYYEILSAIGYPAIKEDDLELSREELIRLHILPVVRKYFLWFPIVRKESYRVSTGEFKFKFPDKDTFGVTDVRFVPYQGYEDRRTINPLVNSLNYKLADRRMYGTRYDYGMEQAKYIERAYALAKIEKERNFRFDVNADCKKLTGYTNDSGEIIINWAKISNDFSKIPLTRKTEVINLCKAAVIEAFITIRSQLDAGTGVSLNTDFLEDKAKAYEESVMEKWKNISKPVIIRS